jgi:hypothetical protein
MGGKGATVDQGDDAGPQAGSLPIIDLLTKPSPVPARQDRYQLGERGAGRNVHLLFQ